MRRMTAILQDAFNDETIKAFMNLNKNCIHETFWILDFGFWFADIRSTHL